MSKNIGDQIKDAIQDAITTQDFSSMKNIVERSIETATASISAGIAQAQSRKQQKNAEEQAEYIKRQNEYFAQLNRERQEQLAIQKRFAPSTGMKASGIAMAIGGGVLATSFGIMALIAFIGSLTIVSGFNIGAAVLLVLCGASIGLGVYGAKRAGFANRFQAYRRVLGARVHCTLRELATQTGETDAQVTKDIQKMIGKGMFREGHIDDQATTLMVTNESYSQYRQAVQSKAERERQERLINDTGLDRDSQPLSSEAKAMLERGQAYLAKIRESNDDIPDEVVSQKIEQIETVLQSIFSRAQEHPEVIPDLEQLMNYYLPVTVKLLDAYEELDRQPIQSETLQASKKEISDTLDTLNTAFEKLLDTLFQDTTWDVSTDISVLHTVLAQEGLVNDPFEKSKKEN